jgi:hypothetical protein
LLALLLSAGCEQKNDDDVESTNDGIADNSDRDNDGVTSDVDCDDNNPNVLGPTTWYADGDGDGFGDPDAQSYRVCDRPTGTADNAFDCDDTRAGVNPSAQETCGFGDEDCDGLVDDEDSDVEGQVPAFADIDGDGYGNPDAPISVCAVGDGSSDDNTDCDDTFDFVNPDADEVCRNGIEDNCVADLDICKWDEDLKASSTFTPWTGKGGDFAGSSLAAAGDVTGDGRPDLLVGMPYSDQQTYNGGAVAVLSGAEAEVGSSLYNDSVAALIMGTEEDGFAGLAVSGADLDGDGYSDVVMGAPDAWTGVGAGGQVTVYAGPLTGNYDTSDATARFEGIRVGDRAGRTVSTSGDVNDDGLPDLVIGSGTSPSSSQPVAAWVISNPLSSSGLDAQVQITVPEIDRTRVHVVMVTPDVNGDGIDDLVIGSPDTGAGGSVEGALYLHLGPITASRSLVEGADATWTGGQGDALGTAIVAPGDVNGDGNADLLVGAPGARGGAGMVTLLDNPALGGATIAAATFWEGSTAASAGHSIAVFDHHEDGKLLLVGGPTEDTRYQVQGGVVWVSAIEGEGGRNLADSSIARFDGGGSQAGENFGQAIASPGDLDGDSYNDIAIGAPNESTGGVAAGGVYIVPGMGR